jgi:hypothetical protein
MTAKHTAGQRIVAEMDAALATASKAFGQPLSWTEHERHAIAAAARTADRSELLARQFASELAGENRPTILVTLSAELRLLDRATAEHLGRVQIGPGVAKSQRHQRAINARWDRVRERQGGA